MQNPSNLTGKWLYRSFHNIADSKEPPKIFGQGDFNLLPAAYGELVAEFDFGKSFQMKVNGVISFGNPYALRFQAKGIKGTQSEDWVYDYKGYLVPNWAEGINQVPAIVGSVIRSEPHGQNQAGYVASFIMLKKDEE
ncbi:MAG: hypothetical protein AAGI38_20000 [Bacteroidota bacterium]